MDLNDFSQEVFNNIEVDFRNFAKDLGFAEIMCIPMSALDGDNVTTKSDKSQWYKGKSLLNYLEDVDVEKNSLEAPFRLPVQWVNRPNLDFRGFSGTIASGTVKVGDEITVVPSGKTSKVKSIVTYSGDLEAAREDMAITLTLEDEIDISRGDIICHNGAATEHADQLQAHILWMSDNELFPGRQYILKTGNKSVPASVTSLKHRIDVNDLSESSAKTLGLNEIGICNLSLGAPIAFDAYTDNRNTGNFILIDRQTNATVGLGLVDYALHRSSNVVWQDMKVDRKARSEIKHQKPALLWFTGLSGSGKSTIASLVEKRLLDRGRHTYTLDGDNVRHGLNRDLGFTKADRIENMRRIGDVSALMVDAGLITLASFISPYRQERQTIREKVGEGEFVEVFVNTPLEVCEARDVKGLYARARAGEIKNFTGIDSEYQAPEKAEIEVKTDEMSAEDAAELVVKYLEDNGYLQSDAV